MKTPVGEAFTVPSELGGLTYYTYPCKYEDECPSYNPARTVTVTFTMRGESWQLSKPNPCVVGGGLTCKRWKRYTDLDIGFYESLPNRSSTPKGYSYNYPIDHRCDPLLKRVHVTVTPKLECDALDKQDAKLKRLKGLEMQSL